MSPLLSASLTKTALWALSTLIFVVIVAGVLAWNLLADRKAGAENER